MFGKLALGGIWAYQQYISPNKGFRCAYAIRHGGTGCSCLHRPWRRRRCGEKQNLRR